MKYKFWTSTEYGGFMHALMHALIKKGILAEQKFNISERFYRSAKSPLERVWLRICQYIVYPMQLCLDLLFDRLSGNAKYPIVVSTNTFFAPLLATLFNKNVIHLVYDLFPEAMIHSGKWKEGQFKVQFFRWLVGLTLKRSKVNVFLGKRLQLYVESVHGQLPNCIVIPVGADERPFQGALPKSKEPVQILYCGNFGNMHDSNTLCEALKMGIESDLQLRFHCTGPKRNELAAFLKEQKSELKGQVVIGEGLSSEDWVKTMKEAQVALVTMSEGSEEVVMPSKTYSAMMAGQAILAIAPEQSDLVDLIKGRDCGWWVKPNDVDTLRRVFSIIVSDSQILNTKRENAYKAAHEQFGQESLAKEWQKLFISLESDPK